MSIIQHCFKILKMFYEMKLCFVIAHNSFNQNDSFRIVFVQGWAWRSFFFNFSSLTLTSFNAQAWHLIYYFHLRCGLSGAITVLGKNFTGQGEKCFKRNVWRRWNFPHFWNFGVRLFVCQVGFKLQAHTGASSHYYKRCPL